MPLWELKLDWNMNSPLTSMKIRDNKRSSENDFFFSLYLMPQKLSREKKTNKTRSVRQGGKGIIKNKSSKYVFLVVRKKKKKQHKTAFHTANLKTLLLKWVNKHKLASWIWWFLCNSLLLLTMSKDMFIYCNFNYIWIPQSLFDG